MCVSNKISLDGKVSFNEEKHEYIEIATGKKLLSCTTLIHKHFPSFDEKALLKKKADWQKMLNGKKFKRGEVVTKEEQRKATQKYWKSLWQHNRDEGTLCHAEVETFIINPGEGKLLYPVFNPRSRSVIDWVQGSLNDYKTYDWIPEMIVSDGNVAGQVDLVLKSLDSITIVDWKFTNKIRRQGFGGVGTSPITSHLVDCNYNTYSLQLSVYAYLLELQGFHIERLVLVHCDSEGVVTPYEIPFLRAIAKELVESVKNE